MEKHSSFFAAASATKKSVLSRSLHIGKV